MANVTSSPFTCPETTILFLALPDSSILPSLEPAWLKKPRASFGASSLPIVFEPPRRTTVATVATGEAVVAAPVGVSSGCPL